MLGFGEEVFKIGIILFFLIIIILLLKLVVVIMLLVLFVIFVFKYMKEKEIKFNVKGILRLIK